MNQPAVNLVPPVRRFDRPRRFGIFAVLLFSAVVTEVQADDVFPAVPGQVQAEPTVNEELKNQQQQASKQPANGVATSGPVYHAGYASPYSDKHFAVFEKYEQQGKSNYEKALKKGNKRPNSIRYYGPGRSYEAWNAAQLYSSKTWVTGRDSWWFFTAGDEHFYRALSTKLSRLEVSVDFFRLLDTREREKRFKHLGLINEPNFIKANEPDEYGFWLDQPVKKNEDNPMWESDGRHPPDPYYPKDEENYGLPSGIVGVRLFRNPRFTDGADQKWKSAWQKWWEESDKGTKAPDDKETTNPVATYFANPGKVEPPYLTGITCAFCHVAFDPTHPPADPTKPRWENLSANIGNQFFREGDLFFGWGKITGGDAHPIKSEYELDPYKTEGLKPDNFLYQYGNSQQSGTSETSRFSYDFINNPNTINKIFYVGQRARFFERTPDGRTVETLHVLKDGADSVGIPAALSRVYVNIGAESEYWLSRLWNPLEGTGPHPLSIAELTMANSVPDWRKQELKESIPSIGHDWERIVPRMPALANYLTSYNSPFGLTEAVNNEIAKAEGDESRQEALKGLLPNQERARRGASLFANYCAKCHSNKQPTYPLADTDAALFYKRSVMADDFLDGNTLTNDRRYSVTTIGTNAQRAYATNAIDGEIWAEFSSADYKTLPPVGTLQFETPLNELNPSFGNSPIRTTFVAPGGGRGYYRTPSLVSLWATAPYLHNNSVGSDPYKGPKLGFDKSAITVEGRIKLFEDGIHQMLGLRARRGAHSIKLTTEESSLFAGLDRTKLRIKSDAIWQLAQPLARKIIAKKIAKTTEDPVVQKILQAAADEALAQAPAQLPALLRKFGAQKQELLAQLKMQLIPILKGFVIPKVESRVKRVLEELGYSEEVSNDFSQELLQIVDDHGSLDDLLEELKAPGGSPANLFFTTIPSGTPLNLVLNQSINSAPYAVQALLSHKDDKRQLAETLLKLSDCPDIVEDHGHNFPTDAERKRDGITDDDLEDLVEFLKTL